MRPYARYVLKKGAWYLLTFFTAVTLVFMIPRLIPGNPIMSIVAQMSSGGVSSESMQRVYESFIRDYGLDEPVYLQYIEFMKNLFQGSLGISFSLYPMKVTEIIREALPWSLALQVPAILVGWIAGNALGAYAAYRKGMFDKVLFPASLLVSSMPYYVLAILLQYVFGVYLGWLPPSGGYSMSAFPSLSLGYITDLLSHYALPFLSLVAVTIGGQAIGMREMSIYELNTDYVNYSKMLGLDDRRISSYIFRNAMLPQITGLAISLGTMVGGSMITEIVFGYPGIGTWLFRAIRQNDYPLIQGIVLMITIAVLFANFLIDIMYGFMDPRIRAAQMEET